MPTTDDVPRRRQARARPSAAWFRRSAAPGIPCTWSQRRPSRTPCPTASRRCPGCARSFARWLSRSGVDRRRPRTSSLPPGRCARTPSSIRSTAEHHDVTLVATGRRVRVVHRRRGHRLLARQRVRDPGAGSGCASRARWSTACRSCAAVPGRRSSSGARPAVTREGSGRRRLRRRARPVVDRPLGGRGRKGGLDVGDRRARPHRGRLPRQRGRPRAVPHARRARRPGQAPRRGGPAPRTARVACSRSSMCKASSGSARVATRPCKTRRSAAGVGRRARREPRRAAPDGQSALHRALALELVLGLVVPVAKVVDRVLRVVPRRRRPCPSRHPRSPGPCPPPASSSLPACRPPRSPSFG